MKSLTLKIITALFILTTVIVPFSAAAQTTPATTPNTTNQTNTAAPSSSSGGFWDKLGGVTIGTPLLAIDGILELAILPIAGFILWLTGQMLDFTISYSLDMAKHVADASSAIILGWTIIRDIFNMMFIFVVIWVAIATMLDISKWSAKQMLTKIIIAAVLINFSFFITEVIIDAGNIFGAWFYNGIVTTLLNAHTGGTSITNVSLSAGISDALGVFNFNSVGSSSVWGFLGSVNLSDITQRLISSIIRLGIVAFTSYIFAYVAVLFVARTVSLLFSLVTSPIGFAGRILPQTEEYAKRWWKELGDNVLLAPVFLLFLYIIMAFVGSSLYTGTINLTSATGVGAIDPTQYFKFFLLAFMLLYALKAAKEHSGQLGTTIGNMANQLGQAAVGAATGGAGLVGQLTIGAAAARLAGNQNLNQAVAGGGLKGAVAGFAQKRISGVADYHFNPAGSILTKETGYKTGKGYNDLVKGAGERQKKATEALAASPKDTKDAKGSLETSELNAYSSHKLGDRYKNAHTVMSDTEKAFEDNPTIENNKAYKEAQKEVERLKTIIDSDPTFNAKDKILEEQEKTLKGIREELKTAKGEETDSLNKKIDAMTKAMAQGRAIQSAQKGPGISITKVLSGQKTENISENTAKVISKTAQIFTAGLSKVAAEQYLKDNSKAVKGMRDAAEGKGGKKEKDLSKLIAEIAADGAESAAPKTAAPEAGPATPPPAGGAPPEAH